MDQIIQSDQMWGAKSYSQHGEDLVILNLCHLLRLENPSYLDLGAHHPFNISNTALLYRQGSRGVNVEANPNLMESFDQWRPTDKNVCIAVDVKRARVPFFMLDDHSGLNSLKRESIEQHGFQATKEIVVQTMTITEVVNFYCMGEYPDILFTDLEGLDIPVLNSADFKKTKPKIICSEIREHEDLSARIMLVTKGFTPVIRMVSNLIFVQSELYNKCI